VLAPDRVRVPVPALVRLKPVPLMTPPTVRLLPLTVTVRLPPRVTAPVPRFRLWVPVKVKLPFQTCALLLESVIALPVVLSMMALLPPAMVNVPVPSALALLIFSVPALIVVPPLYVLAPAKVRVPVPALANVTLFVFEITPMTARVPPAACVKVWVEPAAAPRTIGAWIVLVPLVFAALIALVPPVPVLVSVSLMLVFELVRS